MEELVFKFDESEPPKKKEVITYEPVEKGIRRKLKDGKTQPKQTDIITPCRPLPSKSDLSGTPL